MKCRVEFIIGDYSYYSKSHLHAFVPLQRVFVLFLLPFRHIFHQIPSQTQKRMEQKLLQQLPAPITSFPSREVQSAALQLVA